MSRLPPIEWPPCPPLENVIATPTTRGNLVPGSRTATVLLALADGCPVELLCTRVEATRKQIRNAVHSLQRTGRYVDGVVTAKGWEDVKRLRGGL